MHRWSFKLLCNCILDLRLTALPSIQGFHLEWAHTHTHIQNYDWVLNRSLGYRLFPPRLSSSSLSAKIQRFKLWSSQFWAGEGASTQVCWSHRLRNLMNFMNGPHLQVFSLDYTPQAATSWHCKLSNFFYFSDVCFTNYTNCAIAFSLTSALRQQVLLAPSHW